MVFVLEKDSINYSKHVPTLVFIIGIFTSVYYSFSTLMIIFCVGFGIYIENNYLRGNSNTLKNNKKTALIITDPDVEIDDEIALYFLFEKVKSGKQNFSKIYIAFAPGIHSFGMTGRDRIESFRKYFPEYPYDTFKINSTNFYLFPAEKLKSMKGYHFDTFLQIAPLSNIGYEFFENNSFNKRIVMGDKNNPKNSINLSKSWNDSSILEQEFQNQENALINVPCTSITTGLTRKVPFNSKIINKLPMEFRDKVKDKAFQLLVSRVPPNLSFCENVTVNANWNTAKGYLGRFSNNMINSFKKNMDIYDIEYKCEEFMDRMTSLNDRIKMKEALVDIYITIMIITGNGYHDSNFNLESLDNFDKSKEKFISYINDHESSLTPAYDLLAMHIFLNPEFDEECYDENLGWEKIFTEQLIEEYS